MTTPTLKIIPLFFGAIFSEANASGAVPVLVKEIASSPIEAGSNPRYLSAQGKLVYFWASAPHPRLWVTDGTPDGTRELPEADSAILEYSAGPLIQAGNSLFFRGKAPGLDADCGLWRIDNATSAPSRISTTDCLFSRNGPIEGIGSDCYFTASDVFHGEEFWKDDGSGAGSVLLKDIALGAPSSRPLNFKTIGPTLFFTATDGFRGYELWKSDGTAAGTAMVKDIKPEPLSADSSGSYPESLTNVNGMLFFMANGYQLWKSDGSETGTVMVKDFGKRIRSVKAMGASLYLVSNSTNSQELWRSEGTESSTTLVRGGFTGGSHGLDSLTVAGSHLYFREVAVQGFNTLEHRLWQTEGTPGSTSFVKTLRIHQIIDEGSGPNPGFAVIGGSLCFFTSGLPGEELWITDGTAGGPRKVCDTGFTSQSLAPVGGTLFFAAYDAVHGTELWRVSQLDPTSPLEVWRKEAFGEAGPEDSADEADPDRDGFNNLIEWGLGLDPNRVSKSPFELTISEGMIDFRYYRSTSAVQAGAMFRVQWSDSLAAGDWHTADTSGSILPVGSLKQRISTLIPAGAERRRFVRLEILAPL